MGESWWVYILGWGLMVGFFICLIKVVAYFIMYIWYRSRGELKDIPCPPEVRDLLNTGNNKSTKINITITKKKD